MMSTQSSVPESLARFKNLLLTGLPGFGKTTVLDRALEHLGDLRLAGFLTLELREHGQRVGFEAVGLGGRRVILAHVRFRSLVSVGRYGVEPDRLGSSDRGGTGSNSRNRGRLPDRRDRQDGVPLPTVHRGSVPVTRSTGPTRGEHRSSGRWFYHRGQESP